MCAHGLHAGGGCTLSGASSAVWHCSFSCIWRSSGMLSENLASQLLLQFGLVRVCVRKFREKHMRPPFRSKQEVIINAPVETVWAFNMDITKILPFIPA